MMWSFLPILLLGTGGFYLIRLKAFFVFHPIRVLASLKKQRSANGVSPIKAMVMALAGTLGVGNIVGVATALYLGGAGAVFWMIFSALVAMVLKYAEICLAVRHRRWDEQGSPLGGAPYYIRDGFQKLGIPKIGKWIATVFGVLCLVNTFTMGSMLQSNAVASAMEIGFHIPLWVTGVVVAVCTVAVLKGGAGRIASLTEKLVPLMTLIFLILCMGVLILRRERIGGAVTQIMNQAFDFSSMGGGLLGFLTSQGVRYGIMRGLVSNEAGCGTAPMAHATAETDSPAMQGVLGIVEVFVDTVVLCTMTALTILVSDSGTTSFGEDGVRMAKAAFVTVLGDWSGWLFSLSIFFFGVATILCWAHYGKTALRSISESRPRLFRILESLFPIAYAISVVAGAVVSPKAAWTLADVALAVMTVINLLVLLIMHREVKEETRTMLQRRDRDT